MRTLGAKVDCNKGDTPAIVNAKTPDIEEIKPLINTIEMLEKNEGNIDVLMEAYKKAVEYYSGIESDEYIVYLNKIKALIEKD